MPKKTAEGAAASGSAAALGGGGETVQRTLALIRPDALRDKKDEILAKIQEAGFQVQKNTRGWIPDIIYIAASAPHILHKR